jgi:ATP-dependent DNA ligase
MSKFALPRAAALAEIPREVRLQIASSVAEPPTGDGWLHEMNHDGHRLVAIVGDGSLVLLSRNGRDRTALFREPFRALSDAGLPPMVLDGEIAVPDDRGVTHIDALSEAIWARRSERFAYFAFDLLHLDGHDLRRCPIEDRKALLRDVVGATECPRIVHVDYVVGIGRELFESVRQIGGEGIISKRAGSAYRGGESRDWQKTKCCDVSTFVITGFTELGPGRLEAVYVAEERDGELVPAGQVKFGLARTRLWDALDWRRDAGATRKGFVPVRPELVAEVTLPRGLDPRRRAAEYGGCVDRVGVAAALEKANRAPQPCPVQGRRSMPLSFPWSGRSRLPPHPCAGAGGQID